MAIEGFWEYIPPINIISISPTRMGTVIPATTAGFKVGMMVTLRNNTGLLQNYTVVYVDFEEVWVKDQKGFPDLSAFGPANAGVIEASEQKKIVVPEDDQDTDRWEKAPTNADRNVLVDQWGRFYSSQNPLAVQLSDGSINVGTVNAELEVQLSHKDNDPDAGDVHDSVRLGDGQNEITATPSQDLSKVGLNIVSLASVFTKPYSRIRVSSKNDDGDPTEIITSFAGVDVQMAAILYDSDGDFQNLEVMDL